MEPERNEGEPEPSRVMRRQQRTRQRLTEAASRLIAAKGVDGLRLREITDAADIGFGSFYSYFDTKEQLVEAVATELMSAIADSLVARVREFGDPAESASAAHRWFVRTAVTDPQTASLMINLDHADVVFQKAIAQYGRDLLERGMDSGRFKQMDVDVTLTYVIGATIAVTRSVLDGRHGPDAETSSAEVLLGALGLSAEEAVELARRELPDNPLPVRPTLG